MTETRPRSCDLLKPIQQRLEPLFPFVLTLLVRCEPLCQLGEAFTHSIEGREQHLSGILRYPRLDDFNQGHDLLVCPVLSVLNASDTLVERLKLHEQLRKACSHRRGFALCHSCPPD
jgi:hypothetical protein